MHLVAVAPTYPLSLDVVARFEVRNDPLHRTLCDAHLGRDVTEPDLRLLCDEQQHMRVVAQERPPWAILGGGGQRSFGLADGACVASGPTCCQSGGLPSLARDEALMCAALRVERKQSYPPVLHKLGDMGLVRQHGVNHRRGGLNQHLQADRLMAP